MATASKKSSAAHAESLAEAPVEVLSPVAMSAVESAPHVSESVAEIQDKVRSALEKGVVESKAAFAKARAGAGDAANAFEQSFAAAKDGAVAINAKALEALRANAEANFDFMKATFRVKSLSDLVALQSEEHTSELQSPKD